MDPFIIAHRGAMTEAPENSKAAFDKAVSCGVDGIEFDVQITRDRCPVIFHDDSLIKINGSPKSIPDYSFQELSEFDFGSWFSSRFKNQRILTLEQVLLNYGSKIRLMIEIKPSPRKETKNLYFDLAAMVVESVRNLVPKNKVPNMFILSFDPEIIKSAYINDPDLNYVLNLEAPLINQDSLNIDPEILCGYCIEHTHIRRQFVENVHQDDKILMTYSCNTPQTLRHLVNLDLDVIMTDDPGSSMWKQFDL